ncbi:MAG: hypothetical protein JWQ49_828 [Edaphobacter sp.]|nr:hypothetical protein [Edaphobacter sp.]
MRIKLVMFAMLACITFTMAVGQTVSVNYNRSKASANITATPGDRTTPTRSKIRSSLRWHNRATILHYRARVCKGYKRTSSLTYSLLAAVA